MKFKLKLKKLIVAMIVFMMFITMTPNVNVFATATGLPGVPSIEHNQWEGDYDGNYDISWNLWYGNNATSWSLYEKVNLNGKFEKIQEGKLTDNSPGPQKGTIAIRDKAVSGTLYYYVELSNSFGTSKSKVVTINVGEASVTSKIFIKEFDIEGNVNQITVPLGKNEITLDTPEIKDSKFKLSTNNNTVINYSLNGNKITLNALKSGRASLKIVEETTGETRLVGVRVKNTDGSIPALPDYLSIGSVSESTKTDMDFWKDFSNDYKNKRMDVRYIYVNGGPGPDGWVNSEGGNGSRVKKYLRDSLQLGAIPFFVYYNIPAGGESWANDYQNANNRDYMKTYYKNLKLFLDICKQYGKDETVGIIYEPDFIGYVMQQSNTTADKVSALVDTAYETGILTRGQDPDFPNTVQGLVQSINYITDKYYKQAYFGWQFNIWSYSGTVVPRGLMHSTEFNGWENGREEIKKVAKITADYYIDAGVRTYGADFISIDKYGFDGAGEGNIANDPKNSIWLWNADLWTNYLLYTKTLHETTNLPVILWQMPVGHLNSSEDISPYTGQRFKDLTNVKRNFEDSSTTYFLGDTFKPGIGNRLDYFKGNDAKDPKVKVNGDTVTWGSHMEEVRDSGVVSVLFGAGVGDSTDGVGFIPEFGNQPTDYYFWITKVQKYFDNPILLKK
ncbi:hypothetical protein SAMN02745163_00491 [Clostridium cavendishii DSM 21758]|uniref:Uncharacterized protein n=1 Tax=Clostridium cavendishii DSM 21758 TaxID=1121302 RepID=A0A1M6CKS3_9CLOT|nr:hypothetical protein [Clostridium cavendishii]SHI61607.1 hypothetical protein SAMN02745163_00491 [Clostridium cavendishii DSM 21758]